MILGCDYDSHAVHLALYTPNEAVKMSFVRYSIQKGGEASIVVEELKGLLSGFKKDCELMLVEAPVYIQNPKTSFVLARVRTLIEVAASAAGLKAISIESTKWKKLSLGQTRLNKEEVRVKINTMLGTDVDSHWADAAAMALAGEKILRG